MFIVRHFYYITYHVLISLQKNGERDKPIYYTIIYQVFANRPMKKNGYHIKNLRRFRITGMQKDNKKKIGKSTDWILCKLCFNIIALTTFQLSETISLKKTF